MGLRCQEEDGALLHGSGWQGLQCRGSIPDGDPQPVDRGRSVVVRRSEIDEVPARLGIAVDHPPARGSGPVPQVPGVGQRRLIRGGVRRLGPVQDDDLVFNRNPLFGDSGPAAEDSRWRRVHDPDEEFVGIEGAVGVRHPEDDAVEPRVGVGDDHTPSGRASAVSQGPCILQAVKIWRRV